MKPSDKLAAARARACRLAPYFRTGILTLIPHERAGLGTLAVTENGIMLWDPAFVDSLPQEQLAAVVIHEWLHVMYKHAARAKAIAAEDHEQWNIAADAAINDSIGALPLPPDCVTPAAIKLPSGMTAEGYYRELMKRKQNNAAQQKQQQSGQNNNNQKQSGGNSSPNQSPQNNNNSQSQQSDKQQSGQQSQGGQNNNNGQSDKQDPGQSGQGTQSGQSQAQSSQGGEGQKSAANDMPSKKHKCGGCAGNAHEIEKDIISKEQGRSSAEMTRAVKQVAEAVKREAAKGVGNISGGLAVWADQMLAPPRVNWRQKLAQLVRDSLTHTTGAVTHRYTKPSRRQAGLGYGAGRATLPALIAPIPRVAVAVDTSGSMGTDEINKAMAEIKGILKFAGAVDFVSFDTKAGTIAKINNIQEARKNLTGSGGTDFRPVLAQLGKGRPAYNAVIMLTDGGGYAPTRAPAFKVIWALVGRYKCVPTMDNGAPVTWGHTINVDD